MTTEQVLPKPHYFPRAKPEYCNYNDGDCSTCPGLNLRSYDCKGHRLLTHLEKAVEIVYKTGKYPMFCGCWYCDGLTSISGYGEWAEVHLTKPEVLQLALMQHGKLLAEWHEKIGQYISGNATIIPRVCDCSCDHVWEETSVQGFWHVATCTKCGLSAGHDTSD
jgi:hypothetical protein